MPKMEASDRFQGLCLESLKGHEFMDVYDAMPVSIREIFKASSFNICPACLQDQANKIADGEMDNYPTEKHYRMALSEIEQMIRCEEIQ